MAIETRKSHVARGRILARLERETRAEHEAIEAVAVATGFMTDEQAYRRYLGAMYGFFATLEPELHRALPELEGRSKLEWLRTDLATFGDDADGLAQCSDVGMTAPRSAAFGAAYVVEGSTLGGRFILDRIGRAGVAPGARTFFAGYGASTGARWKAFVALLTEHAEGGERDEAIIAGANATFRALRLWLSRLPRAA